jgi:hypothetical protein
MSNQFAKGQNSQHHGRAGEGERNAWQGNERGFGSSDNAAEGQGQRGYGRAIYGESGLGEPNGGDIWDQRESYGRDATGYGQGPSQYGGLGGGYRQGSSGYSPFRDRGSFGSGGDQGFRGRDFGGGGGFAGRGPKNYKRTDERIREDVCDRLSRDDEVDASDISVRVQNGEVILEGTTETRGQKRRAEEIAANVSGVDDVHNNVRVRKTLLNELKDKVTGNEERGDGHAGSGTKSTASSSDSAEHNRH